MWRGSSQTRSPSSRGALATKRSSLFALPSGLLRFARNDAERTAEASPRHCEEHLRRSNPVLSWAPGLLRFARNDGERAAETSPRHREELLRRPRPPKLDERRRKRSSLVCLCAPYRLSLVLITYGPTPPTALICKSRVSGRLSLDIRGLAAMFRATFGKPEPQNA
jgi:hypothetical protein